MRRHYLDNGDGTQTLDEVVHCRVRGRRLAPSAIAVPVRRLPPSVGMEASSVMDRSLSPNLNHLLAAIPTAEFERLRPHLELVQMPAGKVLHQPGEKANDAYFPITAVVTLHYLLESGATAEFAGVGNEGVVGVSAFMGGDATPNYAAVLIAGYGFRLESRLLNQEFMRSASLQHVLLRYTQALFTQMTQIAACNRHHSLEQQMCRWLLTTVDRAGSQELVITQQLVASMLGVRRESVATAVRELRHAGLIRCRRGHLVLLNRTGLETRVCECFGIIKHELNLLLLDMTRGSSHSGSRPSAG